MKEQQLKARVVRHYRSCTVSDPNQAVAPDRLNHGFTPPAKNQSWASDTTEFVTGTGKLYLAVVLDLFSRVVVGWALSAVNDRHLTLKALDMALKLPRPRNGSAASLGSGKPLYGRGLPTKA